MPIYFCHPPILALLVHLDLSKHFLSKLLATGHPTFIGCLMTHSSRSSDTARPSRCCAAIVPSPNYSPGLRLPTLLSRPSPGTFTCARTSDLCWSSDDVCGPYVFFGVGPVWAVALSFSSLPCDSDRRRASRERFLAPPKGPTAGHAVIPA